MNGKIIKAVAVTAAVLLTGAVSTTVPETSVAITAEAASSKLSAPDYADYIDRSSDSVTLSWSSVKGADAYRIYKYNSSTKKYTAYKTVYGTSYTVTGLKSSTQYKFRVAALKKSNGKYVAGKQSETIKVKTIKKFIAGETVSCPLFSVTLPADTDFVVETNETSISVYDKEAKESGWGGWAFTIEAYEDPADYSGIMERKIGELKAADGKIYDITVIYASDIQYNYEKYSDIPENYSMLFEGSKDIFKTIRGANGNKYVRGGGMNGKDLYGSVLKKHRKALTEKWDSEKLKKENMSSIYWQIAQYDKGSLTDKIGYAYKDLNGDGTDELLIGEISRSSEPSVIYDIYTMKDRKPVHVVSGGERNRYYMLENGMICNDYSNSAFSSGRAVYDVVHNDTELFTQCRFVYDSEKDEDAPWFIAYGNDEPEPVSKEDYEERMSNFGDPAHIDYTPFSKVK